jgi:chemotaxis protein MotB
VDDLNKQVDYLRANNNVVLGQLKDLSVLSGSQAESIKKSLDNIGSKDAYIQGLQSSIARKDSINMNLVMNLKGAIGDLSDGDINVKIDKGVVYVDISDKLLFKSGSFEITPKAKTVLGKVAKVLAAQPAIEFMVEGHTDSKQLIGNSNGIEDNWDLSVKRATTVVRILQETYNIDPKRMTAAGRSEYLPLVENNSAENRARNRRTRIVILPQLDQFFNLLEKK